MRQPAQPNKPRRSQLKSFLAPVGGWVKNENITRPSPDTPPGAEKLVNFFVTATGAELRGGSALYATLGDGDEDVKAFMRYKSGNVEKLFAAIDPAIYDITLVSDPLVSPAPVVSGLTSGDWVPVQFAVTGGVFLVAVNGADDMRLYDGLNWYPINDKAISQLAYDTETGNFTVGTVVTGATSGAHGTILAIQDNGTSGILAISNVLSGPFQNNEVITDTATGHALANGASSIILNGITFTNAAIWSPGITTADLDFVWSYNNRLFFIEKTSMNFWFADADQVGGALTPFPMGGVFTLGGSLLFGAAWGLESGASGGLSNQCILVSTEGEVAVYQGKDPNTDFELVGVYQIGKPLGPQAWHKAGGDVVISTDIGHIALSQAINLDLAALAPSAVSYPIETAWNEAVSQRRFADWHCVVWPERQMVLIALPTGTGLEAKMYVANARTGRWSEFTGWDAKSLITFQGRLFWGSDEGRVVEGYVTGLDQGNTYTGVYVPLFDDLNMPASIKVPELARAVVRSNSMVAIGLSIQFDFTLDLPPSPSAFPITSGSVWGVARWGVDKWTGDLAKKVQTETQSVGGLGYAMAPALQITSGSITLLATEIIRIDVTFTMGDIFT